MQQNARLQIGTNWKPSPEPLTVSVWSKLATAILPAIERAEDRVSFRQFVSAVNPRYQWYQHCETIARIAQRVADGELSRVMLFVPPRHSKSETISRLFSAYYLRRHPDKWVGINSYSAELAYTLSRSARDFYIRDGGMVRGDAGAVKHWETGQGGGLWAAGVGGPITGKGFHLGIVDDPLKNAEEAASEIIRRKHQDWYSSTFYTRAEPGASIVIIQTRWHEEDLAGWLLSEEGGENVERWHIVNLPALADDPPQFPASCTTEPDERKQGEALCEDRYNADQLHKIRRRIGEYFFDALYQQRPTAKEGDFFKVSKLETVAALPSGLRLCRGWDLAASAGSGSYTAGALLGVDPAGVWYVCDVARGQWSPDDVHRQLRSVATQDGQSVKIHLPQDPGQAGKDQAMQLVRMLAGYPIKAEPVSGSKEARAFNFAAQVNAGNVRLLKGEWNRAFIEELRQFPRGKYKDQVDSASDAFTELATTRDFQQGTYRI